jgi:hypothetical protein
MQRRFLPWATVLLLCVCIVTGASAAPPEDANAHTDFFEREIRPLLIDRCQECHGEKKQESDLRLDNRASLLAGGVSGPAVVPGQPGESLLIAAVRHMGETKMPPNEKLTPPQIAALTRWVELGAPWPSDQPRAAETEKPKHWAFQPVIDPPVPVVADNAVANPIDAFLTAKLQTAGLTPVARADRRTLIRRATYDLTGLPPTPEETAEFERDADPRAYEHLVDRLLGSPHYGEQWGRHWFDIARYSDTKGYVYAREQRFWVHAWVYRDWVVKALNDDLPYDRFLLLQIAADQAAPDDKTSLAAMGFLTLGRRFLGVSRDIIDDRIDVVTRGTMGLTVACARCHDHKYDPIPTTDYYSLYGVFQSCSEQLVPTAEPNASDEAYRAFAQELEKRRLTLANTMAARRSETSARVRSRAGEYLAAQLELSKYPEEGFDQILAKTDLLPTFVRRWQAFLSQAQKRNDPLFVPWHALSKLTADEFASQATPLAAALARRPEGEVNPLLVAKLQPPPGSASELAARYGEVFAEVEGQWQQALKLASDQQQPAPTALADPAAEAVRQVLYGATGPCEVPNEPIVNIEYFFDSDSCNELWRLQNEVDNWILQSPVAPPHAAVLVDRADPVTPRVFKRGNPATKGEEVPRHFVEVVAGANPPPFQQGSGRLELARAIIDPANPLTARVAVNRVWLHHFGAGLVRTPSDFGTRAEAPSHAELLDWLTSRFIEEGWSLKKLHRRIMLSEAYQRNSLAPESPELAAKAMQVDPENRFLWRAHQRRLTFEEMCDSLQRASGTLDTTVGGKASDLLSPSYRRRALYGLIDRQFFPNTLRIFDFANPDLHIPQRSDTTVPQQALFFLNDPMLLRHAQALAARTAKAPSPEERVQQMYRFAYQREATPPQLQAALELVQQSQSDPASAVSPTASAWQYGYGGYDQASQRVSSFAALPHFTGGAWQGGPTYPDAKLGWAQLTAAGGHPGNDLQHAVIRRWVAPRDMQIVVRSELVHEPQQGNGVRGFVVSSRHGQVAAAQVHAGKAELNAEAIDVKSGDTLDFVADIGNSLAFNQFLWQVTVATDNGDTVWNAAADFQGQEVKRLGAWEQLAQVLLSANEFLFVD